MPLYNDAVGTIPFRKMHGCGNDFIVFDDAEDRFPWERLAELARQYCPRRFGVGADGLIAVGHNKESHAEGAAWDYEMRYVNADGSRAEMCGNGIRCLGKYVAEELGDTRSEMRVLTGAGILPVKLTRNATGAVHSVTASMGVPQLSASAIPTTLRPPREQVIAAALDLAGERLAVTAVSMGNPHAVSFQQEVTDYQVLTLGPQVEAHSAFPEKVNAEFVQVLSPARLRMRVWERGCGETWACGTGACASVVAAVLNSHSRHGEEVTVVLNGGELRIVWPRLDEEVQMTGPAVTVFRGELAL
jgi:diaminopimelate epimerase